MAKRTTRRKTSRAKVSAGRAQSLRERRELVSGLRLQRQIIRLARQLMRTITAADDALRTVGRIALERDLPTERPSQRQIDQRQTQILGDELAKAGE